MRTLILIFTLLFAFCLPVFAVGSPPDPVGIVNVAIDVSTVSGIAALVLLVTGWLKTHLFKVGGKWARWLSWLVSMIICTILWIFNIGLFEPLTWTVALIYGIGIALVANGVFTAETVQKWLAFFKAQILKE